MNTKLDSLIPVSADDIRNDAIDHYIPVIFLWKYFTVYYEHYENFPEYNHELKVIYNHKLKTIVQLIGESKAIRNNAKYKNITYSRESSYKTAIRLIAFEANCTKTEVKSLINIKKRVFFSNFRLPYSILQILQAIHALIKLDDAICKHANLHTGCIAQYKYCERNSMNTIYTLIFELYQALEGWEKHPNQKRIIMIVNQFLDGFIKCPLYKKL